MSESVMEKMIEENTSYRPPARLQRSNFTIRMFTDFLLGTIFTEVLSCEAHPDKLFASRQLLTVVGKLQEEWYLAQASSDDGSFEGVRIIQLSSKLLTKLRALL